MLLTGVAGDSCSVNLGAQAQALRLRMYVLCSECAHLIYLAEGNRPQRDVEGTDLIRQAIRRARILVGMFGTVRPSVTRSIA
jgi:hypothetical protein